MYDLCKEDLRINFHTMRTGIFYGSTTGMTESLAAKIAARTGVAQTDVRNVADASADEAEGYDLLLLGSSTWGCGELQDDWYDFLDALKRKALSGKRVALFGCGDMHAAMGDGEISVSGAEVAGYATVTLTALPDLHLVDPLIENGTHLGIIASAESLDAAADRAVHEMVDLLHDRTGVDEAELVMLLSLVADVQVCQMVDPQKTVRFMVPKYVLESLGFKL